ncbi:unnamed protein product [Caenorhabditis sp. 36 PRJEB53466]|nr:unnamed protein product [Caenorhabditis sp. 36 PRJEB53466]
MSKTGIRFRIDRHDLAAGGLVFAWHCGRAAMLRLLVSLFRMVFVKRERVDDDSLARRKPLETPYEGPCQFGKLPDEIIGHIFTQLSHSDAVRFSQTNCQMFNVYGRFRRYIRGPHVAVYISIAADGDVVIRARPYRDIRVEATVIPRENRTKFLRNSVVNLSLRLGTNEMSDERAADILELFASSVVEEIKVHASRVSRHTKDLVNSLGAPKVYLTIGRYSDEVAEVRNVNYLSIKHELLFFQLTAIVACRPNLEAFSAKVTAASLPLIFDCISEWRDSRRNIVSWYFRVPLVEIFRDYGQVPINWRRTITRRIDGSARLVMQTNVLPREEGEAVTYQSVNWIQA